ncbi:hypothetical protein D3C76_957060 [compost metagenome]
MIEIIFRDRLKLRWQHHLVSLLDGPEIQIHSPHRHIDHQGHVLGTFLLSLSQLQTIITSVRSHCIGLPVIQLTVEVQVQIGSCTLHIAVDSLALNSSLGDGLGIGPTIASPTATTSYQSQTYPYTN